MIITGTKVAVMCVASAVSGALVSVLAMRLAKGQDKMVTIEAIGTDENGTPIVTVTPDKKGFMATVKDDMKNAWKKTRSVVDPNGVVDMAELKTLVRKQREGVDIVGEALKEAADAVEDLNNP